MVALAILLYLGGILGVNLILASPLSPGSTQGETSTCAEIHVHKEWRDLTSEQKHGYIQGVLCLMARPPKEIREAVTSRFEEFQATHILLTERVHSVGHFLPWHRHLGTLYWKALRDECGYTGPSAFWDWSRDADSDLPFNKSPIFDAETGFGGDGVPGTYTKPADPDNQAHFGKADYRGCVMDGPFKDFRVHRGPGKLVTTHCIVRGIDETWRPGVLSSNVAEIIRTSETYEDLRLTVDMRARGHIHGSGHGIVGGEMLNIYSAGADPLFYLHHLNLDRVWWKWQNENPQVRLEEVSGPSTQGGSDTITLDFELDFPALGRNVTVRDVMDTSSPSAGCFTFAY